MTSPYSSNLLQQPVEAAAVAAPPRQAPTTPARSVTHVVHAPAAAPQVQYVPVAVPAGPGRAGAAVSATLLGLVVILVGAVALVGAYYATKQASPSADEAAITAGIAARQAFDAGRERGLGAGRDQVLENTAAATALRVAAARTKAYNAAYARGLKQGRSSYSRPTYRGGYSGYRAPRRSYGGSGYEIAAAFGQAQNLANITGAPVDVEIY